ATLPHARCSCPPLGLVWKTSGDHLAIEPRPTPGDASNVSSSRPFRAAARQPTREETGKGSNLMSDDNRTPDWDEESWSSGKVTRRRLLGYGAAAGALGAAMLVPAPWRGAFGQAKPYKIGTMQPLSGTAAAGGKTSLVGVQMAVDRINKSGGINGRPIELIVADYESKPDVGRRKAEKLVVQDLIHAQVVEYLTIFCLACIPVS